MCTINPVKNVTRESMSIYDGCHRYNSMYPFAVQKLQHRHGDRFDCIVDYKAVYCYVIKSCQGAHLFIYCRFKCQYCVHFYNF